MNQELPILGLVVLVGLTGGALAWLRSPGRGGALPPAPGEETETITRTDHHPPPPEAKPLVVEDRLEDKATTFDPGLVDRRPEGNWLVNSSEAVFKLDAPMILPDAEPGLLVLYPSYSAAIAASGAGRDEILPSLNMIDGKAKQFDDGLVAALVQTRFRGKGPKLPNYLSVVQRLSARVGPDGPAAPFLAAGLSLIGEKAAIAPAFDKEEARRLGTFLANESLSKPIGFHTWNKTLSDGYRFLRYFQQPIGGRDLPIARALAAALGQDPGLRDDYRRAVAFDAGLTNRPACLSLTL